MNPSQIPSKPLPKLKPKARRYSGKDVHAWKVQTPSGQVARDAKGNLLDSLDGFAAAMDHVRRLPGTVAVRV